MPVLSSVRNGFVYFVSRFDTAGLLVEQRTFPRFGLAAQFFRKHDADIGLVELWECRKSESATADFLSPGRLVINNRE